MVGGKDGEMDTPVILIMPWGDCGWDTPADMIMLWGGGSFFKNLMMYAEEHYIRK